MFRELTPNESFERFSTYSLVIEETPDDPQKKCYDSPGSFVEFAVYPSVKVSPGDKSTAPAVQSTLSRDEVEVRFFRSSDTIPTRFSAMIKYLDWDVHVQAELDSATPFEDMWHCTYWLEIVELISR